MNSHEFLKSLLSMFGLTPTDAAEAAAKQSPKSTPKKVRRCPQCRSRLKDLQKTGRLGCATCYDFFGKDVMATIHRHQRAVEHVGKVPRSALHREIAAHPEAFTSVLNEELEHAIEREHYEAAGIFRDVIKLDKNLPNTDDTVRLKVDFFRSFQDFNLDEMTEVKQKLAKVTELPQV